MSKQRSTFTDEDRRTSAAVRVGCTVAEYAAHLAAGEKWCWRCASWQPLAEFPPNASTPDGRQHLCGDCKRTYARAWRRARRLAAATGGAGVAKAELFG